MLLIRLAVSQSKNTNIVTIEDRSSFTPLSPHINLHVMIRYKSRKMEVCTRLNMAIRSLRLSSSSFFCSEDVSGKFVFFVISMIV